VITAGTEIFHGKSQQVARGLNTIASRIAKNGDALKEYGIDINDANGNLKSTYTILGELAPTWKTLSSAQQVALGQVLAGTNQYKIFAAVMSNFDTAVKATSTSMVSNGSAANENAKYMESLKAKANELKSAFVNLVTDGNSLGGFISMLLKAGTAILKFADSDIGKLTIASTVAIVVLGNLTNTLNILSAATLNLAKANAASTITKATISAGGLTGALTSAGASLVALGASIPVLGWIALGIAGIGTAIYKVNKDKEAAIEKSKKEMEATQDQVKSLDQAKTALQNENITRQELNTTVDSVIKQYSTEIGSISDLNEARKAAIQKIDEETEAKKKLAEEQGEKSILNDYNTANKKYSVTLPTSNEYTNMNVKGMFDSSSFHVTTTEYNSKDLNSYVASLKKLKTALEQVEKPTKSQKESLKSVNKLYEKYSKVAEENSKAIKKDEKTLTDVGKVYDVNTKKIRAMNDAEMHRYNRIQDLSKSTSASIEKANTDNINSYNETDEEVKQFEKELGIAEGSLEEYEQKTGMSGEALLAFKESTGLSTDALIANADAAGLTAEQYAVLTTAANSTSDALNATSSELDQVQAAYKTYAKMEEEVQKTGKVSVDTWQEYYKILPKIKDETLNLDGSKKDQAEVTQKLIDKMATESQTQDDLYDASKNLADQNKISTDALGDSANNAAPKIDTYKKAIEDVNSQLSILGKTHIDVSALITGNIPYISNSPTVEGKRASGGLIDKSGAYVVGEDPNREIIVGKDYAGGQVVNLNAGDRVINHSDTEKILGRRGNTESILDNSSSSGQVETKGLAFLSNIPKAVAAATSAVEKGAKKSSKAVESSSKDMEKSAKDASDAWKAAFEKEKDDLDHKLAINQITEADYYSKLRDLNEKYYGEASGMHEQYLKEYRQNEEATYKWEKQKEEDNYKTAMEYIKSKLDTMLDALEKEESEELDSIQKDIDALNDEKDAFDDAEQEKLDALNDEKDAFDDATQAKIDALSDEKESFETTTQAEIDALNDKKDAESDEWQAKIDALETENDELEKQKELQSLLESLAKAQSTKVKVLKDGKFQYVTDQEAVDSAQKNLDDYYSSLKQEKQKTALEKAKQDAEDSYQKQIDDLTAYEKSVSNNYQKQLDDLNDLKDSKDKSYEAQIKSIEAYVKETDKEYDQQIKDLNDYKDSVEEDYEEQVENMKSYISSYEDMMNSYEDREKKHIADMLTNGQAENSEWLLRLSNLKSFVKEYNELEDSLNNTDYANEEDSGSGGSSKGSSSSGSGYGPTASSSNKNTYVSVGGSSYIHASGNVIHRASGGTVDDNEITLVGDDPSNSELVVGSKLNGSIMKLGGGSGVIPHKLSDTLVSLARVFGSDKYGSSVTNNKSIGNTIHIGNISLPQVKNGEEFVKYLSNFDMKQFAYSH
jgi:hypothetical protein